MAHLESAYYDLAVIGGGLSATATIIAMLSADKRLTRKNLIPMRKVLVIDKTGSFGGGITYSGPAADDTYLQNPVDRMPAGFGEWLKGKDSEWLATWADHTSPTTRHWWKKQGHLMIKNQIDGLFVPRKLFGHYQNERYCRAITAAKNRVTVQHATFKIINLQHTENKNFILETAEGIRIRAKTVLLAVGMIPIRSSPESISYLDKSAEQFVTEITAKARADDGNLIVLGANAAALDVVHLLTSYESLLKGVNKILLVSRTGILPIPERPITGTEPSSQLLKDPSMPQNAAELVELIGQDVRRWQNAGLAPYGLTQKGIADAILTCLKGLSAVERARILEFHGCDLAHVSRRSVPVYHADLKKQLASGRLQMIRGHITSVSQYRKPRVTLHFKQGLADLETAALVDCRGAGRLFETNDPLLKRLLTEGGTLVQANAAGSGFIVNDRFEASPNLFIMGDLLTGYDGCHGMVWHLQNAPRIENYGSILGEILAKRLCHIS